MIDYCIDFHTGGDSRFNIPQIRINEGDKESLKLAQVFGPRFIIQTGHQDKSFRQSLHILDKKVLLFEGGKSLHIDDSVSKEGVTGALRVMQHLGIRDFSKELELMADRKLNAKIVKSSSWVRAKYSGMFHPFVKLGSKVNKGDVLGSISDPFGYFERNLKAMFAGYVLCINESPIVNQGDGLLHISKD